MNFFRFFARRVIFTIPLLLGITVVAFIIANAIPADPINANLPPNALNDEDTIAAFRKKWGLDKPLHEQYLTYLGNLLRGDMGTSIKWRTPVAEDIAKRLPATIELATLGIVYGVALGVGLGLVSAIWKNSWADYVARVIALIGLASRFFSSLWYSSRSFTPSWVSPQVPAGSMSSCAHRRPSPVCIQSTLF